MGVATVAIPIATRKARILKKILIAGKTDLDLRLRLLALRFCRACTRLVAVAIHSLLSYNFNLSLLFFQECSAERANR